MKPDKLFFAISATREAISTRVVLKRTLENDKE